MDTGIRIYSDACGTNSLPGLNWCLGTVLEFYVYAVLRGMKFNALTTLCDLEKMKSRATHILDIVS